MRSKHFTLIYKFKIYTLLLRSQEQKYTLNKYGKAKGVHSMDALFIPLNI